jgi:hypothetical protein
VTDINERLQRLSRREEFSRRNGPAGPAPADGGAGATGYADDVRPGAQRPTTASGSHPGPAGQPGAGHQSAGHQSAGQPAAGHQSPGQTGGISAGRPAARDDADPRTETGSTLHVGFIEAVEALAAITTRHPGLALVLAAADPATGVVASPVVSVDARGVTVQQTGSQPVGQTAGGPAGPMRPVGPAPTGQAQGSMPGGSMQPGPGPGGSGPQNVPAGMQTSTVSMSLGGPLPMRIRRDRGGADAPVVDHTG